MIKKIKIGNIDYDMSSSAYTQFKYKNDTGRSLLKDLTEFGKKYENISDDNMLLNIDSLDDTMELVLRLAYVMITEADKNQVESYEDFLKKTDNYLAETDWINEVVELATSPLSGNIQTIQKN